MFYFATPWLYLVMVRFGPSVVEGDLIPPTTRYLARIRFGPGVPKEGLIPRVGAT